MHESTTPRTDRIALSPLLALLVERGEVRRYPKDKLLIREGDIGDTLFVILSGRVRVFCSDSDGHEISYARYGRGEYFGEMSLDGGRRSASVVTTEPSACAMVTRQTLLRFIADHPEFAFELLHKVIARARAATHAATELALKNAYSRSSKLLDERAVPCDERTRVIREQLTHKELASWIGCSREMVSRLMKDLESGRYVEKVPDGLLLHGVLPGRW